MDPTVPHQSPADARCAASLILVRDNAQGALEVLMLRRAEREGDMRSGVAVFPGGVLDARDRDAHAHVLGDEDPVISRQLGLAEGGLDYVVAALRETFEEVGLLMAKPDEALAEGSTGASSSDGNNRNHANNGSTAGGHASGAVLPDAASLHPWREWLNSGQRSAVEFARHFGLQWDARGLVYFSHWLTPPGLPKRFDTRFFIAAAPAGQQAQADEGEAVELMWLTPQLALDPTRGLKLLPVTQRTLQVLARAGNAQAALQNARTQGPVPLTMPRRARNTKGPRIVLPDELPYAEVARLDPDGNGGCFCDLLPGRVVQLSPHILRVTAPNPGPMTGPGTNSYLVAAPAAAGQGREWTVIDPGPISEAHTQALLAAAAATGPGRITRILVTHTHNDHSPGAAALAQATGAPVWGRVAAHPQWQDPHFAPQHQPQHGDRLPLGPGCSLRVVHTPGHASNHLCYLLEEEQLLFTGDHVMQGSTVVINPPDGNMAAYLDSLAALMHEPLQWLAPGHGFLVAQPQLVLQGLIAHRMRRHGKVAQALQLKASASLDELLPLVYDDVPQALHPMARRSLLAHVLKLQHDGQAGLLSEAADERSTIWRWQG